MAIREQIAAKTEGFIVGITAMGDEQRAKGPSKDFTNEYNKLVEAVACELPGIKALLPPKVKSADTTYAELLTYCHQLTGLVANA
jgi:hypothetical protein